MKILFTSEEVIEVCNGRYYSMNLEQHLTKYKYLGDIVCVCYYKEVESSRLPEIDKNSAEFFFTQKMNSLKALRNKKDNEKTISELIGRKDVDCAVCHVPSDNSSLAIKHAKIQNKPYLTVVVGCAWDALWNYDWRGKCLAPWEYLKLKAIVKNSPFALYVTQYFLQNRYPCKGETEYASNVCIESCEKTIIERRLRKIVDSDKSEIINIITTAAVNVKYKGQEYVIKAIAKLNRSMGYKFHYYLIGSGEQNYLKRIADDNGVSNFVHFLGALPHDKVIATLDKMDIYIQPSKQEGLPRALIEAMSRGLPSIGTKVAGIPELLDSEYLVRKGSVDDIVDVLSQNMQKENMEKQAVRNFNKASEYRLELINARRQAFFDKYIRDTLSKDRL